jgi:uncharacterized sporulation protein YeaH/YhbH (DUF444 family)
MDASGSMGGERIMIAKRFVFFLKTVLRKTYKNVEFRFLIWDSTAEEVPEKKFFRSDKGGSTDYAAGMIAAEKILNEAKYPEQSWNKYIFTIGDSGHSSDFASVVPHLNALEKIVQLHGYVEVGKDGDSFSEGLQGYEKKTRKFRFEEVTSREPQVLIQSLKHLFREEDKK